MFKYPVFETILKKKISIKKKIQAVIAVIKLIKKKRVNKYQKILIAAFDWTDTKYSFKFWNDIDNSK